MKNKKVVQILQEKLDKPFYYDWLFDDCKALAESLDKIIKLQKKHKKSIANEIYSLCVKETNLKKLEKCL